MKNILFKSAAAALLAAGLVSCTNELDISSIDPQSSATYDEAQLLAKQYATLGLTGQTGPAGNGDTSGDEGEIGFYRTTFNLMELCTDECIWAWQTDEDIPAITNISWSSSSTRVYWVYQRLAYDITLYNSYLSEGCGDEVSQAEVRFLRALHYWYFLDFFHKAPFKIDFSMTELPVEKGGQELYEWIDEELTEIEDALEAVGYYSNAGFSSGFGRADKGAAYMLHARLALNSEVYTDGAVKDYQKAVDYCNLLINSGAYALSTTAQNSTHTASKDDGTTITRTISNSGYAQLFMGDNDSNSQAVKEIILPIRQDGVKSQAYAGSTYLVASCIISGMPYCNTDNYWSCNFARKDLVTKFLNESQTSQIMATESATGSAEGDIIEQDESYGTTTAAVIALAGDDRALFYAGCGGGIRSLSPGTNITGFTNGLSIVKWSNRNLAGTSGNDATFMDTDIPLIRYAEAYLTRAEANYRLGNSSSAIADVNVLRDRANATQITSISEQTLIDEWCKEFYMEGRRRSDLNRFGMFTGSSYIWDFKGGVSGGTGVDSHYQYYPIPDNDLAGNPNMSQNPGY